jgi:hypothetical protein
MVLDKSVYSDPNYWIGRDTGTKLAWGYTHYFDSNQESRVDEGDTFEYNPKSKDQWQKLIDSGGSFTNATILDIGGCIGLSGKYIKHFFPALTFDVLDISQWCFDNKIPEVNNFIQADMVVHLPLPKNQGGFGNNAYDVTISKQTLECLTDAELAIVIPEINRITKNQQVHTFSIPANLNQSTKDLGAYNAKELADWALLGFESGTILKDTDGNELVV